MKRSVFSFSAGILIGALLFSGAAVYAAGVMAERSTNRVFVDGHEVQIEAYNIAGNNYCKLRDIGKVVGFNVTWDAAENAVRISTGEPYAEDAPAQTSRVVRLPTDGSKYVPQVGDLIPCGDGTFYEVKDNSRFENNCFAPGPLPDLPEPTCDWSLFEQAELPAPEARHYVSDTGDNLYMRNLHETRRMQYTLYNAIGRIPEAWRDGKPLAKVYLTIPAEYEDYTAVFWPWRAVELEKHTANIPRGRFWIEAWDYYRDHTFMQTQYYVFLG